MKLKDLYGWTHRLYPYLKYFAEWIRGSYMYKKSKDDTLEMIEKAKQIVRKLRSLEKREKKPLNIWVGFFIIIGSLILAYASIYLILPLVLGMFSIIFEDTSQEGIPYASVAAITGFIIICAGLGALTMFFSGYSKKGGDQGKQTDIVMKRIAKLFFLAALSLSLFMLLSPILPHVQGSKEFAEEAIQVIAALSFLSGSFSFVMAILLGLIFFWKL